MTAIVKRGWIGVDVGSRALKLAQVEQAADGLRLREAVVVPRTAPGTDRSLASAGPAACRDELLAALAAGTGFRGRTAACTLSMHWCPAKSVKVAAGDPAAQRKTVGAELAALCGPEDFEFDYWDTGGVSDGAEPHLQEVIAIGIQRRCALEVAHALAGCGLDCRLLDATPLALARAVRMTCGSGDPRPLAAIDWGFADATFCVVAGRTPSFVRRLRGCGFGSVLRQLGGELGLHLDEVETLLARAPATGATDREEVGGELQAAILELAPQALRTLVAELQRTLKYLGSQIPPTVPERLWLLGAGAVWNGAAQFLASQINRPVETWRFPKARIEGTLERSHREEVLAPAVSLSTLAWSSP